jgi:N6-adenosine-specific RNA methylase IME4
MNTTEFVVFAGRGNLPSTGRSDRQWWEWARGKHSAKPEAFLDIVEHVSPAPRLEMFARRQRLGWDTWGNEALQHVEIA